jgi:hypothetical protein
MSSLKLSVLAGAAALGALTLAVPIAHAGVLEFDFLPANTFSGTAPAGTLTAVFTDVAQGTCGGSGGCVQLVITSNLGSNENLDPGKALYLNIDPAKSSELGSLAFTLAANTGFSQAAGVMTGEDTFKPDGDGLMDILFTYTSGTKAFTTGESQTYDISTTLGTISAADFDFSSTCGMGCGTGGHLAAVHVQNTPKWRKRERVCWWDDWVDPSPDSRARYLGSLGHGDAWLWSAAAPAAQLAPHIFF